LLKLLSVQNTDRLQLSPPVHLLLLNIMARDILWK